MGRENNGFHVSPAYASSRLSRRRPSFAFVAVPGDGIRLQALPTSFAIFAHLYCKFPSCVWFGCVNCHENQEQVSSGGRKDLTLGRSGVAVSAADIAVDPPLIPLQVVTCILTMT